MMSYFIVTFYAGVYLLYLIRSPMITKRFPCCETNFYSLSSRSEYNRPVKNRPVLNFRKLLYEPNRDILFVKQFDLIWKINFVDIKLDLYLF